MSFLRTVEKEGQVAQVQRSPTRLPLPKVLTEVSSACASWAKSPCVGARAPFPLYGWAFAQPCPLLIMMFPVWLWVQCKSL